MSKQTHHFSEMSAEDLANTPAFEACVRWLLDKYSKDEYGEDFNSGKFLVVKLRDNQWRVYRYPKKTWFSRSQPPEVLIEVTLNKSLFLDSNHVFDIAFHPHPDSSMPQDGRVIRFCEELSEATGLPITARAGSAQVCFYGYWDDHELQEKHSR
jgi:hypothetical protein